MPFLLLAWFAIAFDIFGGNGAQDEAQSLVAMVRRTGGKELCDNGDGGHGLDNTKPWYQVYLEVDDRPRLAEEMKEAAARAGYSLSVDTQKSTTPRSLPPHLHHLRPETDYFVARKNGNRLQVTIDRDGAVPLYCGITGYGDFKETGTDRAIVTINMALPPG